MAVLRWNPKMALKKERTELQLLYDKRVSFITELVLNVTINLVKQ